MDANKQSKLVDVDQGQPPKQEPAKEREDTNLEQEVSKVSISLRLNVYVITP